MSKHLNYNQLIIAANIQGRNLKLLDAADKTGLDLDEDYTEQIFGELGELSERLYAIGIVLAFLRDIPNAYLNPEAMDAIQEEVEHAERIAGSDWAVELLEPHSMFAKKAGTVPLFETVKQIVREHDKSMNLNEKVVANSSESV